MDLENNKITYDDYTEVDYNMFYDAFVAHWRGRVAGETISPFEIERFMKRSSSKNLKQLIDGKKAEGILEATLGKKLDPGMIKLIIGMLIIGVIIFIVFMVMQNMGFM